MISFVLAIGIFNLALGYCAALALAEPPPWTGWRWLPRREGRGANGETTASTATQSTTPSVPSVKPGLGSMKLPEGVSATIVGISDLPADWLDQLASVGIAPQSFIEGTAHVLRLEVNRYREQMVTVESRIRVVLATGDAEGLRVLADDLRALNQDWLDKQSAAADMLAQRSGCLGDHEAAAAALEQVLLDQAAQIRAACAQLESPDAPAEIALRGKQLLEQIAVLLGPAHALRDRMLDLLATLLTAGKNLEAHGAAVQLDQTTGLPNRIGLELHLANWWREDPQRTRLLSVVLVDLDRFSRINQRLGTRSGDRTIGAIARLIGETLTAERGCERLVRLAGQTLLIVLGDSGPRQALTAAERLRQAIEATTFDDEGNEFELTLSCGVVEVDRNDTVADVVRRSFEAVKFAKKAGRNRCALDEGQGPISVDPPQFPVKGRVIPLDALPTPLRVPAAAVSAAESGDESVEEASSTPTEDHESAK